MEGLAQGDTLKSKVTTMNQMITRERGSNQDQIEVSLAMIPELSVHVLSVVVVGRRKVTGLEMISMTKEALREDLKKGIAMSRKNGN